jgi:hypothetical protein
MSVENHFDRHHEDSLGVEWDGKLAHDVSVDMDDDAIIPSDGEEFVNFDKFDDAISNMCDPLFEDFKPPVAGTLFCRIANMSSPALVISSYHRAFSLFCYSRNAFSFFLKEESNDYQQS